MRIDIYNNKYRPWYMALGLKLVKLRLGTVTGPPVVLSYRPDIFQKDFLGYIARGMAGSGGWTKGEAELFASFVSKLNQCRF